MIPMQLRWIREKNRVYSFLSHLLYKIHRNDSIVYLFHDIVQDKSEVKSKFSLSVESFERFLNNQLNSGKIPFSFEELKNCITAKKKVKNRFIISFDDANESVLLKAYPILKKLNIPFIIFITVELIGKENFLSEEQIKQLVSDPLCTLGSHGCHHKMFRYLSKEEVKKELIESKKYLESTFKNTVECFAFPYGRLVECSFQNIEQVKKASAYSFSFSAIAGNLKQSWITSNYFLPRINVDEEMVGKSTLN
jgi:peptidoglycan/xylan/chitin deacetylase (PgdA/CDA1 family)